MCRGFTMRLSGGDGPGLGVELVIDGKIVRTIKAPSPASETFAEVSMDVVEFRGQTGTIVLRDNSSDSWGHLNVDKIWMWP